MNMPKTEVFKGEFTAEWYFRVKAANGEILCQSEGYTTKVDAERGLRALRRALLPGTREERYTELEAELLVRVAWNEGAQWVVDLGYTPSPEELKEANPYK